MNIKQIKTDDKKYFMNTFGDRMPVCFTRGEGCMLYDTEGKEYLDFFAGIATNCLGYAHPVFMDIMHKQLDELIHVSSVYYIEPQAMLAKKLVENSFADKVFFASTGSEANEGAVKLVRKYFYNKGENKFKVITLNDSFHGRTLAMVAATGQEKYQKPFRPLPEGFVNVDGGDIAKIIEVMDDTTAAVMLESVQCEGGIILHSDEYLRAVRKLCDDNDLLLILDEVQTGMGRTGKLFGYQHSGITPDIMTLAKALGGGIPIGAILATDKVASAFSPGDHGTTFGGNPFSTRAGLAVFKIFEDMNIVADVAKKGKYLLDKLNDIASNHDSIVEVRGQGLAIGIQLKPEFPAKDIMLKGLEAGYVIGIAAKNTVRLMPPLIISIEQIDTIVKWLDTVLI